MDDPLNILEHPDNYNQLQEDLKAANVSISELGTGQATKTDEFSESIQRGGGVIFNPKIYVADFRP